MPKVKCPKCGKVYHGWALKYKECYCDCGEKLSAITQFTFKGKEINRK